MFQVVLYPLWMVVGVNGQCGQTVLRPVVVEHSLDRENATILCRLTMVKTVSLMMVNKKKFAILPRVS